MELVFPRDNSKLRAMFLKAACPPVDELEGLYRVDMLTGFKLPANFKMISNTAGYNLLFGSIKWGHFKVEEGMIDGFERVLVLNYDVPENMITTSIRDYVRRIAENVYLGAFNCSMFGRSHFAGYFTLTATQTICLKEMAENALPKS